MLLERAEIDPDKPTNHGRTPLSYAAGHGHTRVVKVLSYSHERGLTLIG